MVSEVNKLIFNTLVDGGSLYIQDVGSLNIVRKPAIKSHSRVESSAPTVEFSTERKGESLANIIASVAAISTEEAEDIARRWQHKVSADGKVVIDGVGAIQNNTFIIDSQLANHLISSCKTIQLTKEKRGSRLPWIILLILLICGLGVGAYLYYIYDNTTTDAPVIETQEEPVTPETAAVDEVVTTESETQIEESEVVTPEPEQPAEVSNETPTEEVVAEPAVEEEIPAQTATTDWREESVRNYVIFGSYSTLNNANVAIRQISRKNPEAQCKILTLGKMYAVAVFGSNDRKACEEFKRANRQHYKNAWIHTPKHLK